jgi:hypothetical protein
MAVFAKDRSGISVKDVISLIGYAVTGIGGFLASLFVLLPIINRIGKATEAARKETLSFVNKWKGVIDNGARQDLKKLVKQYDDVTERVADLLEVPKIPALKRLARKLRSLIDPRMFD